jgi:hypothetical protein
VCAITCGLCHLRMHGILRIVTDCTATPKRAIASLPMTILSIAGYLIYVIHLRHLPLGAPSVQHRKRTCILSSLIMDLRIVDDDLNCSRPSSYQSHLASPLNSLNCAFRCRCLLSGLCYPTSSLNDEPAAARIALCLPLRLVLAAILFTMAVVASWRTAVAAHYAL